MSPVTRAHALRRMPQRMRWGCRWATSLAVVCTCSLTPQLCQGQTSNARFGLGLRAGVSSYDLDGTGTAFVGGPTAFVQIGKLLVVEFGLPVLDYSRSVSGFPGDASSRTRFLLPEVSMEVQARIGRVAPYLGAGGGGAIRLNGQVAGGGTLHAAGGVRVRVGAQTRLRGEVRARAIRPWSGSTVDFAAGVEFARW